MSKTMHVILTQAITLGGSIVAADEVVELTEKSAQALIDEGKAEAVEPDEETGKALNAAGSPGSDETGDPHLTPSEDGKDGTDGQPAANNEEEIEKLRKALDDKYKGEIPALKDHAKEVDVQFAHDATKGEIIAAVIEAGKGEAVLAK
jgi:hypothetical protein